MNKKRDVILVTVRGHDVPGITSTLTKVVSEGKGVELMDIEQTVVHGKLLLSILLGFDGNSKDKSPVLKDLLMESKKLNISLDFEAFENSQKDDKDIFQYVITCLGESVGAAEISRISTELAAHKINIDKIARLSHKSIRCIEMIAHAVRPLNIHKVSKRLLPISGEIGVDIAIQKYGLLRQAKRLVVLDMDSTLVQNEVVDDLGRLAGVGPQIERLTAKSMAGEMSYPKSLRKRCELLRGLTEKDMEKVYGKLKITNGAESFLLTLKKLGYKTALVSGGFTYFTDKMKTHLGFDYAYANTLELENGRVTGKILGPIIDRKAKADILQEIARHEKIGLDQTIAIGDGANDIAMLAKAGLGIAFRAKPLVLKKAKYSITRHSGLDSILFLLGIPEKEVLKLKG